MLTTLEHSGLSFVIYLPLALTAFVLRIQTLKESDALHHRSSLKKRSSTTAAAMAAEAAAEGGPGGAQAAVPAHTSLRTRLSR